MLQGFVRAAGLSTTLKVIIGRWSMGLPSTRARAESDKRAARKAMNTREG